MSLGRALHEVRSATGLQWIAAVVVRDLQLLRLLAWHQLYVPGGGDKEILKRSSQNLQAPGGQVSNYPLVTQDHWQFSCLPTLANGEPGGDFLSTFAFRHDVSFRLAGLRGRYAREIGKFRWRGESGWFKHQPRSLDRQSRTFPGEALLYPTRISDRFGNAITLNWSGSKLLSMSASDGRQLDVQLRVRQHDPVDHRRTENLELRLQQRPADVDDLAGYVAVDVRTVQPAEVVAVHFAARREPGRARIHCRDLGTIRHPCASAYCKVLHQASHPGSSWWSIRAIPFPRRSFRHVSSERLSCAGRSPDSGSPLLRWQYDHGAIEPLLDRAPAPAPVCVKGSPTTKDVTITSPDGGVTKLSNT